jgi:DNA-binding NarL/FixJ family response regulator
VTVAPTSRPRRRVLLVEDEQLTRALLASFLELSGFDVAGCGSAEEAIDLVETFDPDAVVTDISLGNGANGLDMINALAHQSPHLAFVILSNFEFVAGQLDQSIASAYLRKKDVANPQKLVDALNSALLERSPSILFPATGENQLTSLTPGQIDVLKLLASGATNAEIARSRSTTLQATEQMLNRTYKAMGIVRDGRTSQRVAAARIYAQVTGLREFTQEQ